MPSLLILDFSALTTIEPSGLGTLISGLKAARQAGGDLKIAAPNEQVKLLLHLGSLDQVLKSCETADRCFDEAT